MRIRVEVEWQGQPWRQIKTIRKIAVIDSCLGVILALIYVYKLCLPNQEPTFRQYLRSQRDHLDLQLAFVFLMAANIIQAIHALRMYLSANQREGREPAECFICARRWFDYSKYVYPFAIVKCMASVGYVFTVAPHVWVIFLDLVTVPEMVFKMWAFLRVNRYMRDLKQSLKYMPRFKFIPVAGEGPNEALLTPSALIINDKDHLLGTDFNANFQQLV